MSTSLSRILYFFFRRKRLRNLVKLLWYCSRICKYFAACGPEFHTSENFTCVYSTFHVQDWYTYHDLLTNKSLLRYLDLAW
jgi:hypothetical protein